MPLTPSGTAIDGGVDYSASGTGYNAATGVFTMGSASGSAAITITPVDDAIDEGTETITFTLGTPDNGYSVTSRSGTINLNDNDGSGSGSGSGGWNVTAGSVTEPSTVGGQVALHATITLDAPATEMIEFEWQTEPGVSPVATHGLDYDGGAIPDRASIPVGGTSVPISVVVKHDTLPEPTESVPFVVRRLTPAGTVSTKTATGTIVDNGIDELDAQVVIQSADWLDPDGNWIAADPGEVLWVEDTLRWVATPIHSTGSALTSTTWYRRLYNSASAWQAIGSSSTNVLAPFTGT